MSNKERGLSYARSNSIPYSDVCERIFPSTADGVCMTILTAIEIIIVMVMPILPILAFIEVGKELQA